MSPITQEPRNISTWLDRRWKAKVKPSILIIILIALLLKLSIYNGEQWRIIIQISPAYLGAFELPTEGPKKSDDIFLDLILACVPKTRANKFKQKFI